MTELEQSNQENQNNDTAGVAVHPPVLVLGCLIIALVLDQIMPLPVVVDLGRVIVGGLACGSAVVVFVLALRRFSRAGTNVQTSKPSTTVVTSGVYGFSRNPIYLSMCTFMVGLSLLLNSLWMLLTLGVIVPVLRYGVITREEAYLERKFGDAYLEYKKSVRRWF